MTFSIRSMFHLRLGVGCSFTIVTLLTPILIAVKVTFPLWLNDCKPTWSWHNDVNVDKGKSSRKRIFYGQADCKCLLPPMVSFMWIFLGCVFDLKIWLCVLWKRFYARIKTFLSNYNNSLFPHTACCCSVTKWSDSGIAEALLKDMKNAFLWPFTKR